MNLNLSLTLTFLVLMLTTSVFAQDYDYVLPDSLPEIQKRSSLTLPIKPREPQPTYIIPSYVSGQEAERDIEFSEDEGEEIKSKQNRTTVGLEVGSSVATDFNGNSAIRTYAAPNIRYEVNDRIAISGGVVMSQTFFNGWTNYNFDGSPMPSTLYSNTIYGRIDYRVNDKMVVYGEVYSNLVTTPGYSGYGNLQGTGFTAGMQYKVSERSFIQIQISRSTGYNPYNPYSPYSTGYGFGHQPIGYFP